MKKGKGKKRLESKKKSRGSKRFKKKKPRLSGRRRELKWNSKSKLRSLSGRGNRPKRKRTNESNKRSSRGSQPSNFRKNKKSGPQRKSRCIPCCMSSNMSPSMNTTRRFLQEDKRSPKIRRLGTPEKAWSEFIMFINYSTIPNFLVLGVSILYSQ